MTDDTIPSHHGILRLRDKKYPENHKKRVEKQPKRLANELYSVQHLS
jgi:hypothetical protein